jgi:lipopolysaccharide/colanic/teichoic acid biosynthesis glycosyltransferase
MHGEGEVTHTLRRKQPADSTRRGNPCLGGQNHRSEVVQRCLAAVGMVLIAPVLLGISLLIKLASPGPVLYRGLRVGKDRHVFTIYKFRTLLMGSEEKIGSRLLTEQDACYTAIGKFLKRTKLDELPQLFNVLKGEMNLVGPRPIRPIFLERLSHEIPGYDRRFNVKPGMTGLAQVRGGYFTKPKDKLRYELMYMKHQSLAFDLRIMYLTLVGMPREFSSGPFSPQCTANWPRHAPTPLFSVGRRPA